ncbi:MAG: hypothetical protein EPO22_01565 [Dehalococcoidia bacterium]|nr:MAG: hypothetical protein EPO22_01565 [Dehalococcoidia bacterium]
MSNGPRNGDADFRWFVFAGAVGAELASAAAAIVFVLHVLRLGQSSQTARDWCIVALLVVASGIAAPILLFGSAKWAAMGVPPTASDWRSIAIRVGIAFAIGLVLVGMFSLWTLMVIANSD